MITNLHVIISSIKYLKIIPKIIQWLLEFENLPFTVNILNLITQANPVVIQHLNIIMIE